MESVVDQDEKDRINNLCRQVHHHSSSTRQTALSDLNQVLGTSDAAESYMSLVVPTVMELLFDEDKDTRGKYCMLACLTL